MRDEVGALPELGDTIAAVRDQLIKAQEAGRAAGLLFRVGPVELDFEMAVSYTGGGQAGVRIYVVTLGAKAEVTSGSTHHVKVTLQPVDPVTGKDALIAGRAGTDGPPGGWAPGAFAGPARADE